MSALKRIIQKAIQEQKSIWLELDDGSSQQLNTKDGSIEMISGEGCEYVQRMDGDKKILYNLAKIRSIKID